MSEPRKKRPAVEPALWEVSDAAALQALVRGNATPDQQQRAINWIIYSAAATYELAFKLEDSDSGRATTFALGRQFVGSQIVKMLKINTAAFRRKPNLEPERGEDLV